MKCFVIMPFDETFDDVYAAIKQHVGTHDIDCSRLDEASPAGRITDRLLAALRDSTLCISDLTGLRPNVMWETGYAMALGKPTILITQDVGSLPFDVKDMLAIGYDRSHLTSTLGRKLQSAVRDTVSAASKRPEKPSTDFVEEEQARTITSLGIQLAELKGMVGEIVRVWAPTPESKDAKPDAKALIDLSTLEGSWVNEESETHIYIRAINGRLVAPYCYYGNEGLTAYYYDWKKLGEYVFARFEWLNNEISGFTFLKPINADLLQGGWWSDREVSQTPDSPPPTAGTSTLWKRQRRITPKWALDFFVAVQEGRIEVL